MATKLFLIGPVSDWSTGTNDANLRGSASPWVARNLSTTAGTSLSTLTTATVAGTTLGVEASEFAGFPWVWYSPPLDADITISGSITWNIWGRENDMAANVAINGRLEVIDGATGTITLIDQTARTTEMAVSTTTNSVSNFAETPASGVACKRGDRLRVRIFGDDVGTMASGFTFTIGLGLNGAGANGDTWLQLTENLTFVSEPAGTTIYPTDTASAVSTASVDREAWTSRGAGVQTDVTNTAAGWTAPIQVTDSAGGTVVDWFTKQLTAFTLGGAVRVNLRGLESDATANAAVRCEIARVASDGTSPTVWGATTTAAELGTTEAAQSFLVSGDDLAISDGQRLRIRFAIDEPGTAAMGASQTVTLYYAGTSGGASGDTYLTFTQTLTEFSAGTSANAITATGTGAAYNASVKVQSNARHAFGVGVAAGSANDFPNNATSVTDTFNRTNESPIGSPWDVTEWGGFEADLTSNQVHGTVANGGGAASWGTAQTGDFEAVIEFVDTGAIGYIGHHNAGFTRFFETQLALSTVGFDVKTGPSFTADTYAEQIISVTPASGDLLGLRRIGPVTQAWYKSVSGAWQFAGAYHSTEFLGSVYAFIEVADAGPSAGILDNFRLAAYVTTASAVGSVVTVANAQVATATGAALDSDAAVAPTAQVAAGTGTAYNATVSTAVSATAGVAAATGTAYDATATTAVSTSANAQVATGTGATANATTSIATELDAATATGTAIGSTTNVTANLGAASGTGAAYDADLFPSQVFSANVATATGQAYDATATGAGASTSANAQAATATGTATAAAPSIAPDADLASATGTAITATAHETQPANLQAATATGAALGTDAKVGATTQVAAATGTALPVTSKITVNAGAATASGAALVADGLPGTRALANVATATGAALVADGLPGELAPAEVAAAAGAAQNSTSKIAPTLQAASATGTANNATVSTASTGQVTAQRAEATGAAQGTDAAIAPRTVIAAATGAALSPDASLGRLAGAAAGTGAAVDIDAKIAPRAGVAAATGTAVNASVTTVAAASANAQVATATGAAHAATVGAASNISATAGAAAGTGTAYNARIVVAAVAQAAAASGQAQAAAIAVAVAGYAATATGTGIAYDAGVALGAAAALAEVATAYGTAYNARVQTAIGSGIETGGGIHAGIVSLPGIHAGVATAPSVRGGIAASGGVRGGIATEPRIRGRVA